MSKFNATSNEPIWLEDFDDDDNSIWEAASPYHDDGSSINWRLKQRIHDNKIEWYACHDEELITRNAVRVREWPTLAEAKLSIAREHAAIIKSELRHRKEVTREL